MSKEKKRESKREGLGEKYVRGGRAGEEEGEEEESLAPKARKGLSPEEEEGEEEE